MKILEKSDEKISFVEEIDESLANAIRRSILEVPVLAIDEVEFYKNDSSLYDEILALRLGLTPIAPGKKIKKSEAIKIKLKGKGEGVVYARQLEGNIDVIYPDIPLTYLSGAQEIELVATAKQGTGLEHTKYSPGLVYYSHYPKISEIGKQENAIEIDESEFNDIKDINEKSYDYLGEVVKNKNNYLKIEEGKELIFNIESWGQLKAKDIFTEAVKALKNNLKSVK